MSVKERYYIGITNKMISIYDNITKKLQKPILIEPLIYKNGYLPKKLYEYKKLMTMTEMVNWKSKILRYRIMKKYKNNLIKPEKLYMKKYLEYINKNVYGQKDIYNYIRQVYRQLFKKLKIKRKEVISICFVLNERDDYRTRTWIMKHSKKNHINRVHIINWRTALLMELLAKSKIKCINNEKISLFVVFNEFYQIYNLIKQNGKYHVKDVTTNVNDFKPITLNNMKNDLNSFNPDKYLIYLYGNKFIESKLIRIYFEKIFLPKPVVVLTNQHNDYMDCINGAILKARSFTKDSQVMKYDVVEACYTHTRINMDNKLFIKLDTYLKEYPFIITTKTNSTNLYYLWLENNNHGLNNDWKVRQIYPHSFVRDKITVKVEFDSNGISKIVVVNPPQAALEDRKDYTFTRFKIRKRKSKSSPLAPLKFKASGKRITRTKTPTNYIQNRVHQVRQPKTTPPPVVRNRSSSKPKRKINDPNLKNKLRTTAERMGKWQTRKFLME